MPHTHTHSLTHTCVVVPCMHSHTYIIYNIHLHDVQYYSHTHINSTILCLQLIVILVQKVRHSLIHSLTHSLTHLLTYSLTHSLTTTVYVRHNKEIITYKH